MLGPIQPRAIRLSRIEQQCPLGAVLHRVYNYCNWVARLVRRPIPALADLDVDARRLHIPRPESGGVRRVRTNCDDDVAVWVPELIVLTPLYVIFLVTSNMAQEANELSQ
jgi:hypothetical protein